MSSESVSVLQIVRKILFERATRRGVMGNSLRSDTTLPYRSLRSDCRDNANQTAIRGHLHNFHAGSRIQVTDIILIDTLYHKWYNLG